MKSSDSVEPAELDSSGSQLLFSTLVGGRNEESGTGIALDGAANIYICGTTTSLDFPTTAGAIQPQSPPVPDNNQHTHGFVVKIGIDPTQGVLSTIYSTYLGGTAYDFPAAIVADGPGNAFVGGQTVSPDFPVTAGAFQTTNFGSGVGFITKINLAGTKMLYSTFLGGTGGDMLQGLALDQYGRVYATGITSSSDFPIKSAPACCRTPGGGNADAFASALNSMGAELIYSTFLGGNSFDTGKGIGVGPLGHAFVAGITNSEFRELSGYQRSGCHPAV